MAATIRRRTFVARAGGVLGATLVGALAAPAVRAQSEPIRLKLGNDLPASHSVNVRLAAAIQAIAQETGNRLQITLFPNNQLGSDTDMMSQLRLGAMQLATMPGTVLSTFIPVTALTGLGFVFPDYAAVWKAMDGAIGDYIRAAIARTSLVPFGKVWDNGFRQTTSSTHPIRTPADLHGFKLRVPVVPLWVSMFSALGAAPTSIPLSEAYAALQTRVADGQENPLALIYAAKFYEVQSYCSLTNHAWDGFWLLANGKSWHAVPPDLQRVAESHFDAAATAQRADSATANADLQRTLEGKGLRFNATDPAQFRAALEAAGFYRDWHAKFGDAAWSMLEASVGRIG